MKIDLTRLHELVNEIYLPVFSFTGRFLVLYGGSGSGKSWSISQKIIYRMITEDNHNILCIRKTGNTLHKSSFALLVGTIKDWGLTELFKINEADGKEKIVFKANGNQIIFSGLDDKEKLKSIYNITSCWIEEASEVEEQDFRELNRRMRGYQGLNKNGTKKYMQFMISFNPISQLHWLKKRFYDIPDKLLIWDTETAKKTIKINRFDTLVIHSTYKDNKYIDEIYKQQMEELKNQDEYEYEIYALGFWGVVGHTYFSGAAITKRINYLAATNYQPVMRGYFEFKTRYDDKEKVVLIDDKTITWVDDPKGCIKIFEKSLKGYPYVIGADTAGEGSDWNVAQCLNNVTDKQVATLALQHDEDLFARQLYCLGKYYSSDGVNALIAVETNFSTHPMKILTDLQYPNQYIREERPDAFTNKLSKVYGFNTNKATRPDALGKLRAIVRDKTDLICDVGTLNEMTTFIVNEKGRPEAAQGSHDDYIMSLAISYYVQFQQTTKIKRSKREKSMIEKDFERKSKALKRQRRGVI